MSRRSGEAQAGDAIVLWDDEHPVSGDALRELLTSAYVGGGFTEPDVAAAAFAPDAVRARGRLSYVASAAGEPLATLVIVRPESPAVRLAKACEAELHLLATAPSERNRGLASTLIRVALDELRRDGCVRVWLWTQPPMVAAQRLYSSFGFNRYPDFDFERGGRSFLVYQLSL